MRGFWNRLDPFTQTMLQACFWVFSFVIVWAS